MKKSDNDRVSQLNLYAFSKFLEGQLSVNPMSTILKAVLSVRKQLMEQLPEGRFGPTKYNKIGTFERTCL